MFGIPMIAMAIPAALISKKSALMLFLGGWTLQFVGHYVFEKNSPLVFRDGPNAKASAVALIFAFEEWHEFLRTGKIKETTEQEILSGMNHGRVV